MGSMVEADVHVEIFLTLPSSGQNNHKKQKERAKNVSFNSQKTLQ